MMTKEMIYGEIDRIDDTYLDDLYHLIFQFAQAKQSQKKPSLMAKLRRIQIDAPTDFAANLDLYISGEKHATPNLS